MEMTMQIVGAARGGQADCSSPPQSSSGQHGKQRSRSRKKVEDWPAGLMPSPGPKESAPDPRVAAITKAQASPSRRGDGKSVSKHMLIFRCRDNQPYTNARDAKETDHMEPVYLSPHFDFDTQQLVDPKHIPELIKELEDNPRIQEFDKRFMASRLKEQKLMKAFGIKDQKAAAKKIK